MARRITPPDEINRINDRLFRESKFKIQDRDSYDLAFNDLLSIGESDLSSVQRKLRNDGFKGYLIQHPDVAKERIFTKAKGRDLRRDRLKTARRVVDTRKEFTKLGASKSDLRGFDTARQRVTKDILTRRKFTVPARVKGRIVFAIRTSVTVRGKRQVRFRNEKGQFSSAKVK